MLALRTKPPTEEDAAQQVIGTGQMRTAVQSSPLAGPNEWKGKTCDRLGRLNLPVT